ncbi:transposase [Methylosinus sp. H3A]|uniref:transposase n=1 Tax=Methylosinus sp. H3A TaxID=2785786 RepID=UPI001FF06596|nr:transposase [Methylosinus sp. H3A]
MNENATVETALGAGFVGRVDFRRSRSGNRLWSKELKGRIVRESLAPGARVADVACKYRIWTFNIGANYEHPLGAIFAGLGGFGSLDDWTSEPLTAFGYFNVNWQDKTQLTNPWSIRQYWQRSYAIVNVGAGIRTDDDKYSLTFWPKNIGDERPFSTWDLGIGGNPARVGLTRWPATFGGAFRVKLY